MNNIKRKIKYYSKELIFVCLLIISFKSYGQDLIPFTNQMTGKKGFIDESGKIIIKPNFDEVSPFYDGIAIVRDGMENYYINSLSQKILKEPYRIHNFSCGYGLVQANKEYFFIDKTGKVVSPKYRYAMSFSDDKAIIFKENKLFAVNKSFQILFEIEVDPYHSGEYFGYYNNGLMPVKNIKNMWGYLDSNGKLSLKPSYIYPGKFCNGHAIIRDLYGKWMVINKLGEKIYEFGMKQHWDMPAGHSFLIKDKLIYNPERGVFHIVSLSDKSDKEVIISDLSDDFNQGYAPVALENYIFCGGKAFDLNGNIVWKLDKFRSIKSILYGKYILVEKSYDDVHLYKYDGTEIIYP